MLAALFGCNTARQAFYDEAEAGWEKHALPDSAQLRHTVFVVGGSGGTQVDSNTIFPLLAQTLQQASRQSTVVFLGDNVPAHKRSSEKQKAQATASLDRALAAVHDFPGQTVFLPGDADWQGGCDAIEWQQKYVEKALGEKKAFLPGNCCGQPEKLKITDGARLLFADSQWWVQGDAPQEKCGSDARFSFLEELREELKKQEDDRIVLFMHHPLRSNGPHGGSYSWRHHLFPLTLWKKSAWLPLPVIGSLIVLSRKVGGHPQDLPSYRLVRLEKEMDAIVAAQPRNESVIFVGAHDQSLQLFSEPKKQYLVSGSATGTTYARGGKDARFVQSRQGFAKLYFYENKEVWVEFFAKQKPKNELVVVFRKKLFGGIIPPSKIAEGKTADPLPDSITVSASNAYDAGTLKKLSFGDRYREAWATPVKVPVFNLGTDFKHLKLTGYGGGMSSKSLRLEDEKGQEYVLRSVEKDVSGGLPAEFRQTVVKDLIQDLKSGSHPYGAFAVPTLAEAVGIYHTNPRLYYLPKQERLGAYNEAFAGELYLFEERPNNDWGSLPSFGHSHDIISYVDVLEKIHKSHKHQVDEKWALRSRLFDQFVHDYDRHDDQWRWASFPQGDSLTLYRPIPRDRDQVFFDLRGVVPFILSRRWLEMQQRGLSGRISDIPGEAYPGSRFDRSFLSELDREDWLTVANEMKASLTDSVIENAFKAWPPEVYQLNAPHIIKVLKERRDNIPRHAERLYCFYARYVDVVGTEKRDFFEVERRENGDVEVNVYDQDKNGAKSERFYHRVFKKKETHEVRLYGLGGGDIFKFIGDGRRHIRVRIIGGSGSDQTEEKPGGLFNKTTVYDVPEGMEVEGPVRDLRSNDLKVNEYDRYEFRYNRFFPLATFGITQDDGLLLGGGVRLTKYRFRKRPYGTKHHIFMRHSANTNAVNLRYNLDITEAFGKFDFNPDFRFDRPIIFNFFGLGNGTKDDKRRDAFNWVRLEKLSISPLLKKTWYNGRNFTRFGPFFERVEVENRPGRITDTDIFKPDELDTKNFLGFTVQHSYQLVEGDPTPHSGLKLNFGTTYYRNLSGHEGYTQLEGSFATYISVGSPATFTIATRVGGAALSNDNFLFYHSNNLGGNSYLRGFRNNRFAGRAMFYHNTDLRMKLFYLPNKVMPFEFGVVAGFDYGRVWAAGNDAEKMHTGFSPGFWFTPYKLALVTAFYTLTEAGERDSYTVRLGFFF